MKTKHVIMQAALLVLILAFSLQPSAFLQAAPLGTAFTYQGSLTDGGNPANGSYDLKFILFDDPSGGSAVAGAITNSLVGVTNGLFTTTLDFGSGVFTGVARWLEIGVRVHGGSGGFEVLTPRNELTPAPQALHAASAGTAGSVPATNVTGTLPDARLSANIARLDASQLFSGSNLFGGVAGPPFAVASSNLVADLNAQYLGGMGAAALWRLAGNSNSLGTNSFLGWLDDQPLEFRVNSTTAFRLVPGITAPNLLGGDASNQTRTNNLSGATIGGGGGAVVTMLPPDPEDPEAPPRYQTNFLRNAVNDDFTVVGGGAGNFAGSFPYKDYPNRGIGSHQPIFTPGGRLATVAGGELNGAYGHHGFVGGGLRNAAYAEFSTVGGGSENTAGVFPFAEIIGDELDNDGDHKIDEDDGRSPYYGDLTSGYETVAGGRYNWAFGTGATVGGGDGNRAYSAYATISGGLMNRATNYAVVPGGYYNVASGLYSLAAGQRASALHEGTFVWNDATAPGFASTASNQFLIQATGGVGIGTTDPAGAALRVAGTICAEAVEAASFLGNGSELYNLDSASLRTGPLRIQPAFSSLGSAPRAGWGEAHNVAVFGSYACLANGEDGLRIYDISNPANPVAVGHADPGLYTRRVIAEGDFAYVACSSGLRIYDVSNPASPLLVGQPGIVASSQDICLAGDYAYLADGIGGVRVYDVSDRANPINISRITLAAAESALGVAAAGDTLFVAWGGAGLCIYSITNPAMPVFLAATNNGGVAMDVAVMGKHAYLANLDDGLRIYNVSNPSRPLNTSHAADAVAADAVAIQGRYAYLADWTNGVHVYDVSDASHPVRVQQLHDSLLTHSATPFGDRVFLADGYEGLRIYALSTVASAPAFQGDGSLLTGLNATSMTAGTLVDARLSGNVPRLDVSQIFTGANQFANPLNSFAGDGSALINLNAANLTGIIADSLLSSNVALLGANQSFAGLNLFAGIVTATNAANVFTGTFEGSGAGLDNLDPASLSAGTAAINISGTAATATTATSAGTATSANNFTGTLGGDVTGTQSSTVVGKLHGVTVAATAPAANQVLRHDGTQWTPASVSLATDVTGQLADARLSTNVALLSGSPVFAGTIRAGGDVAGARLNIGSGHLLSGTFSTIAGGQSNSVQTGNNAATICGGENHLIGTNGGHSSIGGGYGNVIGALCWKATIGGGFNNTNLAGAWETTIGGGRENLVGDGWSTVAGGWANQATAESAVVGGGFGNQASAKHTTVAGGDHNQASYGGASVGGGWLNVAGGWCATAPGGAQNSASGTTSFATGRRAKAYHAGAFVWGDSTDADVVSTNDNSVTMRAAGGYRLFSDSGATTGAYLAPGGGSWTSMSDRHGKEDFAPVNVREVLDRVTTLPLSTWKYKSQDKSIRHLGPMAQDFKEAFGIGESDTGITSVDADGVALAAIQGLNQKVELENAALRAENAALKARLDRLEQLINSRNGGGE